MTSDPRGPAPRPHADPDLAALVARPAGPADLGPLSHLWQLFRHDMSDVDGALPDAAGRFRDERLRAVFTEPARQAWLLEAGSRPVGLAVVRSLDGPAPVLSAFFVVRAARRRGAGRDFAAQVLGATPGRWEIPFQEANRPAAAFWRRLAEDLAPGRWTLDLRTVPGRPDLPPDAWITLPVR